MDFQDAMEQLELEYGPPESSVELVAHILEAERLCIDPELLGRRPRRRARRGHVHTAPPQTPPHA